MKTKDWPSLKGQADPQPHSPRPARTKCPVCWSYRFFMRNQKFELHGSLLNTDKLIFKPHHHANQPICGLNATKRGQQEANLFPLSGKRFRGTKDEGKALVSTQPLLFCRSKVSFQKYCQKDIYGKVILFLKTNLVVSYKMKFIIIKRALIQQLLSGKLSKNIYCGNSCGRKTNSNQQEHPSIEEELNK